MISFNSQSRPGWAFATGMLLLMVLLQLIGPETFRYEHNWLKNAEYWRILSAHWVHVNWIHFALNAVGLILCLGITAPIWTIQRWLIYQICFALGISLLFTLNNPNLGWYTGYSGILYGVFLLAAVDLFHRDKLIATLLGVGIVIKIALEQSSDLNLTSSDIIGTPVIVDAHLYGVLIAILIALVNQVIKMSKQA
jgi:rhomboid family GlyGly-CTERM serine protease